MSFDWRRRLVFCGIAFAAASPLLFGVTIGDSHKAARAAGVTLLVSLLWVFDAMPLPIAAIIPLWLLPLVGVGNANSVAKAYFNDTQMLFLASFLVAKAMQNCRLHTRVAIRTLLMCRTPRRVLGAICGISFVTSMWMQNTAVAALMVPLLCSMLNQLEGAPAPAAAAAADEPADAVELEPVGVPLEESESPATAAVPDEGGVSADMRVRYAEACLLGVAYSCSIGGTTTPVGTGPNLVFFAVFGQMFPSAPTVSFGSWMLFAVPLGLMLVLTLWAGLAFVFLRRLRHMTLPRGSLEAQYAELGPVNLNEKMLSVLFVVQLVLWLTRGANDTKSGGWGGWGAWFATDGVSPVRDGTVAVFVAFAVFMLPDLVNRVAGQRFRVQPLLSVDDLRSLPWDIILLLGGGFALADAVQTSGMMTTFAAYLGATLAKMPPFAVLLTLVSLVTFLTEWTSNVSTASIFVPLVGALCIGQSPLFLMVPATICCSFSFALPSATPPNSLVFSSGKLRMRTMIGVGICLNVCAIVLTTLWVYTAGPLLLGFEINGVPAWSNCTSTQP
jgi:sodium-dependent dicarboxylate transporter 2/3/5